MKFETIASVIGIVVGPEGKILISKRIIGNYSGYLSFPGGKFEYGETPEEALSREIKEETGILKFYISKPVYGSSRFTKNKHYVGIFYPVYLTSTAKPKLKVELDKDGNPKTEEWKWMSVDDILKSKQKMMPGMKKAILNNGPFIIENNTL